MLEVIRLYTEYVVAHNEEPESQKADDTFDELYEELERHFDEDDSQYMVDVLCKVDKSGKITMAENLLEVMVNGLI